ncbi:MAG: S1/P1 Nuclease [Bacteroidetes bacterium]|nr:S1/P1 Nuclease [Bacteroidota bacterium]HET6244910.1 zinc dependent phospholipase C family protein [Bacteroidia bacterium]
MKKKLFYVFSLAFMLFFLSYGVLYSWGFFAHKRINRIAVFTLPPNMIGFYKHHIEFVTEHAVDPDKRRYAVEGEAERHFIDVDRYYKYGDNPFEVIPRKWKDAVAKFSEDTLRANGIVPWHIDVMVRRLTDAFREENVNKILRTSADLGHYIGDAHVPLHTTENYNGQLTNQKGIHGFWESRLPELYSDNYDFFVGKANYIEDPLETAWNIVKASFAAKDSVLLFEAELNETFPTDKKYSFENRGATLMKVYSAEYSKAYDQKLNGMVERRMRQTIIMVGSYWYTAWVNAGQPDLKRLLDKETTDQLKKQIAEEEEMWKTGKVKTTKEHE